MSINPFQKRPAGLPPLPVQPVKVPIRIVIEAEVPAHPQATPDQIRQQVLPEVSLSAMLAPCIKTITVEAGLAKVSG